MLTLFNIIEKVVQFCTLRGGGSGGGTTVSRTENYSPEEAARRTRVMDTGEAIYNRVAPETAESPYPGSVPVGPSGATQTAWQQLIGATPAMQRIGSSAEGAVRLGMDPQMLYAESNPYLSSAINAATQPIKDQFLDAGGTLSGIRTNAMEMGGQGTNTRQGIAEGLAAARANRDIGNIASEMSYKNFIDAQEQAARMAALAPGVQGMQVAPGQVTGAVGTQLEAYGQDMNDYEAAARAWELEREWGPLQNWANIVYGGGSSQSTAFSQAPVAQRNKALGALGGAAGGYAIGGLPGAAIGGLIGLFG